MIILTEFPPFQQVMQAFARAERRQKPGWKALFTDVYDDMPEHLQ